MPSPARSRFVCASCELVRLRNTTCRRSFSTSYTRKQNARPPTAPKQFPDIKSIRANPEQYEQNTVLRNYKAHSHAPRRIATVGHEVRTLDKQLLQPRLRLKASTRELLPNKDGESGITEEDRTLLLAEIAKTRKEIHSLEKLKTSLEREAHELALSLPNLTSSRTPTNGEPTVLCHVNFDLKNPPKYSDKADHSWIGQELSLFDFGSASTTTGWGFYYLLNEAALLEHALVQYAISVAMKHGWRPVTPPSLVYSHIADACGFQPRDQHDEQQIWQVAQSGTDASKPKRSLAATAEIPLAGLYTGKAIEQGELPLKLIGSSRCYRAEAGARGVDTKGLYRVHEFTKVEMFAWTSVEDTVDGSNPVFDEMVAIQTEILESLGLPFRVLEMPSNDLGASAYRKIDIEALFPSRRNRGDGWGEVTSASVCTDYQTRRLDTRILEKSGSRSAFPHTLNGTAMAVPRVLAALLENGWKEDRPGGYVLIPPCLRQYMSGQSVIGPRKVKS